jgi:hypothetical protein
VNVYAGTANHPPPLPWVGIATKLGFIVSPKALRQGQFTTLDVVAYGIDAAGALIPESKAIGPQHQAVTIKIAAVGPYTGRLCTSLTPLYTRCPLSYDGVSGQSQVLTATATPAVITGARRTVRVAVGPTAAPQVVAGSGFGNGYSTPGIAQFANGARGDVRPLRALQLHGSSPFGLNGAGDFWLAGKRYSESGVLLGQITPVTGYTIVAGATDAAGDVYLAQAKIGNFGVGFQSFQVDEYAAGSYGQPPIRSIVPAHFPSYVQRTSIAVDGSNNLFVAYDVSQPSESEEIDEFAGDQAGTLDPIRSILISGFPQEMATDAAGNLLVPIDGTLFEYAPASTTGTPLLPGTSVFAVAVDASGSIYAGVPRAGQTYGIEVFPAGASTPSRTIAGVRTRLSSGDSITLTVAP